jgi:hypothetical protein
MWSHYHECITTVITITAWDARQKETTNIGNIKSNENDYAKFH